MGSDVIAPQLIPAEVTSAMRRAVLVGRLPNDRAVEELARMSRLRLEMMPFWPVSERVWELRATISVYDAWYVAIAELTGRPLATLDRRLIAAPGPRCEFLTPTTM